MNCCDVSVLHIIYCASDFLTVQQCKVVIVKICITFPLKHWIIYTEFRTENKNTEINKRNGGQVMLENKWLIWCFVIESGGVVVSTWTLWSTFSYSLPWKAFIVLVVQMKSEECKERPWEKSWDLVYVIKWTVQH